MRHGLEALAPVASLAGPMAAQATRWIAVRIALARVVVCGCLTVSFALLSPSAAAGLIQYEIEFTPTWVNVNLAPRSLVGEFWVDDSILGTGFENRSYGYEVIPYLSNFTLTLNGSAVYVPDWTYTSQIVAPGISTILRTGADGQVVDIQAAMVLVGTISNIILGRDGRDGTYTDVQQVDPSNAPLASQGRYTIRPASYVAVPEPSTLALFALGLAGLGLSRRRKA